MASPGALVSITEFAVAVACAAFLQSCYALYLAVASRQRSKTTRSFALNCPECGVVTGVIDGASSDAEALRLHRESRHAGVAA